MLFEDGAVGGYFEGCVFRFININSADIDEMTTDTVFTNGARIYGAVMMVMGGSVSKLS